MTALDLAGPPADGVRSRTPVLEFDAVSKRFGATHALRHVSVAVMAGEVHAIVGENGSGKSTLVRIAGGQHQPDDGRVLVDGAPVVLRNPRSAAEAGIGVISQEVPLVPDLSVGENILLGRLPTRARRVAWSDVWDHAERVLADLECSIDPRLPCGELSQDKRQIVSIARALSLGARCLCFDEATSSLTDDEVNAVFRIVERLRERGVAIVFISHRLKEVYRLAQRVTVLRDGQLVATLPVGETTDEGLTRLMVGRDLSGYFPTRTPPRERVVFTARQQPSSDDGGLTDLHLREGEIVGLAGLVGSGRSELLRRLFGCEGGPSHVEVDGVEHRIATTRDAIRAGMAFVPEDRARGGLVVSSTVGANLTMVAQAPILPNLVIRRGAERALADRQIAALKIKTPSADTAVEALSGGNQQKVLLGKWLAVDPKVWLLDEPTRGIDVGAKAEIHGILVDVAARGATVFLSSSELPDLLGMCDRVLVMAAGRIVADLDKDEATEERIVSYATGQGS